MTEGYQCKHCRKPFSSERLFMKHECQAMVRAKEIQTIEGRRAYELYRLWLEKQKRKAPPIETFCTSSYYTSFYKFSVWVAQTGIPKPEKYVELMTDRKISPALWRRSESYHIYLEWHDKGSSPIDQAAITVETITALSEGLQCPPGEVFNYLKIGEMLELIQQRRMSPWLLFCSKSFKEWVTTLHPAERQEFMRGIGIDFWSHKLERSPEVVRDLRELAEALEI